MPRTPVLPGATPVVSVLVKGSRGAFSLVAHEGVGDSLVAYRKIVERLVFVAHNGDATNRYTIAMTLEDAPR
jgi:hypothetical protein